MKKIGIISDIHAKAAPVAEAISKFKKAGVSGILCAGDIAGYNDELDTTIDLLVKNQVISISGNHDLLHLDHHGEQEDASISYLKRLPMTYESSIEGKRLYMVHAQPPDDCHGGIKLLDKRGDLKADNIKDWQLKLQNFTADVLIVGHTHQVFAEMLGNTLVLNPGSTVFNNACVILTLPSMQVEMISLNDKSITRTWNWGDHVIYGR